MNYDIKKKKRFYRQYGKMTLVQIFLKMSLWFLVLFHYTKEN